MAERLQRLRVIRRLVLTVRSVHVLLAAVAGGAILLYVCWPNRITEDLRPPPRSDAASALAKQNPDSATDEQYDTLPGRVVTEVIDCRTLLVDGRYRVHLAGVCVCDKPEDHYPADARCREAVLALRRLATDRLVTVECMGRNREECTAYVWLPDGLMLNAELIRRGYASAVIPNADFVYGRFLLAMEAEAHYRRQGIWQDPDYSVFQSQTVQDRAVRHQSGSQTTISSGPIWSALVSNGAFPSSFAEFLAGAFACLAILHAVSSLYRPQRPYARRLMAVFLICVVALMSNH